MRFEKKFIMLENSYVELSSFLISCNFRNIYPSRFVNSLYYDTSDFNHYIDSKEGFPDRSKVRIRFYNNEIEKMVLEYKIKKAEIGYKKTKNQILQIKPIREIKVKNPLFKSKVLKLNVPEKIDFTLTPSLFISYKRFYFLSSCNNFRITIDTDLMFSNLRYSKFISEFPFYLERFINVIEIKYSDKVENLDLIESISNFNEIYLSRCSKYTIGIDKCF